MIDQSQISIIIPHLGINKEEEYALDQCFISLKETVPEIKVLVAKNGPRCSHDNFDVWVKEQDQGTAVNATVTTTNTEWIMVSNSDMIYAPNWWDRLTNPWPDVLNFNEVRCVSPKLIEPRLGAPTFEVYFCGGAGGDFDKAKWLEFAKFMIDSPEGMSQSLSRHEWRTGFNLPFLIKRELWDLIGGYDINYRPWGSNADSDLEYKIRLAGVQPYQNTNCVVYHFSQTSGTFEPKNSDYWGRNFAYFEKKWGFPRTDDGIWQANFEMPKPPKRIYRPWWENFYADKDK